MNDIRLELQASNLDQLKQVLNRLLKLESGQLKDEVYSLELDGIKIGEISTCKAKMKQLLNK